MGTGSDSSRADILIGWNMDTSLAFHRQLQAVARNFILDGCSDKHHVFPFLPIGETLLSVK